MMKYRNELKYICSECELTIIKHRLSEIMHTDKNMPDERGYRIRSLYFDDYYNSAFDENDSGVRSRKKFRIRVYDDIDSRIALEIKYKIHGKTYKESCLITKEQCIKLMNNERIYYTEDLPLPLKMLYIEMSTKLMKPRIIIEYERYAFVEACGNVRITFDRNISYSYEFKDFLDDRIELKPIMEKGQHILEVKYDEFLPDYIACALELGNLTRTAFSKFYLGCLGVNN